MEGEAGPSISGLAGRRLKDDPAQDAWSLVPPQKRVSFKEKCACSIAIVVSSLSTHG